jgi:predicted DNA-binding protein (UPF0251 family)
MNVGSLYLQYKKLKPMARPQKCRKVCNPPKMEGFRPYGMPDCEKEPVILKFEEFESIRLIDYDLLSQDSAAKQMNISRPTFTRIYNRALKTIARAFVEGKVIGIEGGNFQFEHEWYRCRKCYKLIQGIENHNRCEGCETYNLKELALLGQPGKQVNLPLTRQSS